MRPRGCALRRGKEPAYAKWLRRGKEHAYAKGCGAVKRKTHSEVP